jgi:hypothetical protein
MKKTKKEKKCYLCGRPNPDTKDHIPPRGIFPKAPKGNLITVPAHKNCNNDYCKDDELFRNFIIAEAYRSSQGKRAWKEQVVASFQKNPGAKKDLVNRLEAVLVEDPKTRSHIQKGALLMEASLLERQITRITKGLFYHKFGVPLPLDVPIEVEKLDYPERSLAYWNEFFAENNFKPKWNHVAPGIFSYFYGTAREDRLHGMALLVFYETVVWQVFVGYHKGQSFLADIGRATISSFSSKINPLLADD